MIYCGESYYRSNLVDEICIKENEIKLVFQRSKKKSFEQIMTEEKSPIRFQLYRALCGFYAVTGELPKLKELKLVIDEEISILDEKEFSSQWPQETLLITLGPEAVRACMGKDGKIPYIIITYFIKAQIGRFSNDCFRAAWSGINAYYGELTNKEHESAKIDAFRSKIKQLEMKSSIAFVESLDDSFWSQLKWYVYVAERKKGENDYAYKDIFQSDKYRDRTLYHYLSKYYIATLSKSKKDDASIEELACKLKKMIEKYTPKKVPDIKQKIEFLVCDYCYLKRNRNFHGAIAFPIFANHGIDDGVEGKLTMILLNVIKDIF